MWGTGEMEREVEPGTELENNIWRGLVQPYVRPPDSPEAGVEAGMGRNPDYRVES